MFYYHLVRNGGVQYNFCMMQIIQQLVSHVEKIGGLEYTVTDDSISVRQKNDQGFKVILWGDRDQAFVVNYGHYWHGHFDTEEEAKDCFISGLSGRYRLACTYHWRYLTKSVVETFSEGKWQMLDNSGSCLGFLVWWLPKRVVYFQNIAS